MTASDPVGDADIAAAASLFAQPSRARILTALLDGRPQPAGALAAHAGISPQAASRQLTQLRAAGLIEARPSGRRRYYQLASPSVAAVIEALAQIAPAEPIRSLRQSTRARALHAGRLCYDHLAGRLSIDITDALVRQGALATHRALTHGPQPPGEPSPPSYALGPNAAQAFTQLGVFKAQLTEDADDPQPLLAACLDWSEHRHHLAGSLGAALANALLNAGWLSLTTATRAVQLTATGRRELHVRLGLDDIRAHII